MHNLKIVVLALGAFALAVPASVVDAQNRGGGKAAGHAKAGKPSGHAKTSANRPNPQARSGGAGGVSNKTAYKAGQKSGGQRGNTVVVNNNKNVNVSGNNRPGSSGYYDNGRHYDNDRYDDNDNDFLEFVGKTAAITAGVSVVAAVIGSSTNEKPDDCQPVNANGTSYMYCNGAYYQQSGPVSQPTYTVVAPPQ